MEYGKAPESNKEAVQFLEKYNRKFGLFIDGKWVDPQSKTYFFSENPSNQDFLAEIADGNKTDVDNAISWLSFS